MTINNGDMPTTKSDLNYSGVKVCRASKKGRKITIVLESSIYSGEPFAVNPFYDEGEEKNKLQRTNFNIKVVENGGEIEAIASMEGALYTTGHTQIHDLKALFKTKIERAVYEILDTDIKYINDKGRMNKLIDNLESEEEKDHALNLIENRKRDYREARMIQAKYKLDAAVEEFKQSAIMGES